MLLCIARDPQSRARDIAEQVGITERATQRILADLIADGYVTRTKVGRRNHYKINPRGQLRHPVLRDLSIGPLIEVLNRDGQPTPPANPASPAAPDGDGLATDERCGPQRDAPRSGFRRSLAEGLLGRTCGVATRTAVVPVAAVEIP